MIIGGVLLLAIVAASGWGAVVLPADARIAVHYGSENHQYLVSKRAGLLIWPALGVILSGALGWITASRLASASPIPIPLVVPRVQRLTWVKISKIRPRSPAGMPMPLS